MVLDTGEKAPRAPVLPLVKASAEVPVPQIAPVRHTIGNNTGIFHWVDGRTDQRRFDGKRFSRILTSFRHYGQEKSNAAL